jgi:hypothetical protein
MAFRAFTAMLFLAGASTAWAQDDALLPTHLIDGGQVFVTGTNRYIGGGGDAEILSSPGDFTVSVFQLQLDAGVGLGMNFEIDASITYQFIGKTKSDFNVGGNNVEFDSENVGFSDLVLNPRYAILRDSATSPQLIVGGVLVAPVGNDKSGQSEQKTNGFVTTSGEDGGIGDGIWRYGFQTGLSKRIAILEPYLLTSYVWADPRKKNGVEEERADVWNLTLGAFWHLSPMATLDTRFIVSRESDDKSENTGTQVEEEAHFNYTAQAALHLRAGSIATFIIFAGATFVQDHEVLDQIQLEVSDDINWFAGVGLHLLFGKSDPQK